MSSEKCQACGLKTNPYRIFKANDERMVCQPCMRNINYDNCGRPVPPRQIRSIMGIKTIVPMLSEKIDNVESIKEKKDCYYYDMCRERYGPYFNCDPCKVYSKHRGDY